MKAKRKIHIKSEVEKAKMFKDLIRHIPKDWDGMANMAERAGVATVTLYNWKTGITTSPRISTLIKVATVVGYEVQLVRIKPNPKLRMIKNW